MTAEAGPSDASDWPIIIERLLDLYDARGVAIWLAARQDWPGYVNKSALDLIVHGDIGLVAQRVDQLESGIYA